jgi:hypothetical protein
VNPDDDLGLLPESLNPDDELGLCKFFKLFASEAMTRRHYSVITEKGGKQEMSKKMGNTFVRFVAALVVHFR